MVELLVISRILPTKLDHVLLLLVRLWIALDLGVLGEIVIAPL